MLIQEIITEQLFRRSRRLYFTTLHADEMRQHRGITDSKLQTMLSQLEQNQDWLLYMRLQDFTENDTLLVYDPKSNLSAVVAYHRDSEYWKERNPEVSADPDRPQPISIVTAYHGNPASAVRVPKLLKRNKFVKKKYGDGYTIPLTINNRPYQYPKEYFHLLKGITQIPAFSTKSGNLASIRYKDLYN